jgi:hypothetical protein
MYAAAYVLQTLSGITGVASGVLWWIAATKQPVPPYQGAAYFMDRPPDPDTPWRRAWNRASGYNARAAILTGISAALSGVGTLLSITWTAT